MLPLEQGEIIPFIDHGWVQHVDVDSLLDEIPEGTTVELLTAPGRYAVPGSPAARSWPADESGHDAAASSAVQRSVRTGAARTLLADPSYGVRQLADVALRALSPGVNDPTTARDALAHLATVLHALLAAPVPAEVTQRDGRTVVLVPAPSPGDLVALGFDEVRIAAVGQPDVLVDLLEVLDQLGRSLTEDAEPARAALRHQAGLVLACAELGEVPEPDRERVRAAYRAQLGTS